MRKRIFKFTFGLVSLLLFSILPVSGNAGDIHIESIAFNYQGSSAVPIWDNIAGVEITAPEMTIGANTLNNPGADQGLGGWIPYGTPSTEVIDGDHYFVLHAEGSHIMQDIDISNYAALIDDGGVSVTISAIVKASVLNVQEGFPYLYGYLFGTAGSANQINTYMTTGAVKEDQWTYVEMTYQLPAHSRKIRLFMKRSAVLGYNDNNSAYFDNLSVRLLMPGNPSAHVRNSNVTAKVKFVSKEGINNLLVWAEGDLGGLNSSQNPVQVQFSAAAGQPYREGEAIFTVNNSPPNMGKLTANWNWKYREPGAPPATSKSIVSTRHCLYVLMNTPLSPMTMPWKEVLDFACQWGNGENNVTNAVTSLRNGLNQIADQDGDIDYDPSSSYLDGIVFDNNENKWVLLLSDFLDDLRSDTAVMANCYDCAYLLTNFCAAVGISIEIHRIGYSPPPDGCYMFRTLYIDPIGNGTQNPADGLENWAPTVWVGHIVTVLNNGIFDPTLNLDGDNNAGALPCVILVPVDMGWNTYKPKLLNPVPANGPYFPYCTDIYEVNYMGFVVQ